MNSVETAPPTFWVGESGVRSSGNSSSSSCEPPHPLVVVGVVEGRVVEDEVAPARVLDLAPTSRWCSSRASGVAADGAWGMRTSCRPAADTDAAGPTAPTRRGRNWTDLVGMNRRATLFPMKRNRFVSSR